MIPLDLIGYIGIIFVFASFIVKKWTWLYSFNMLGALALTLYAALKGDLVFTIAESGIFLFLLYKLYNELKSRKK